MSIWKQRPRGPVRHVTKRCFDGHRRPGASHQPPRLVPPETDVPGGDVRTGFGRGSDGLRTGFRRSTPSAPSAPGAPPASSVTAAASMADRPTSRTGAGVDEREALPGALPRSCARVPPAPRHPDTPTPPACSSGVLGPRSSRVWGRSATARRPVAARAGPRAGHPPPPRLPGRRATRSGPWDTGSSTPVTLVCGCPCTTGVTSSRDLCGWPPERLGPETGRRSARAHGSPSGPQSRRPSPSPLEVDAAPLSG